MLIAYHSIFQGIPYIVLVIAVLSLTSLIFQKRSSIARSILFSFGFWLAPLFYLTYVVLVHQLSIEIAGAFIVEFVILISYLSLFSRLLTIVSEGKSIDTNLMMRWLKTGLIVIIILASPLLLTGSFGIFSETSRNDYLADSRWYLYSLYASILIQAAMVPVVASILNSQRRWNKLVIFYLVIISTFLLLGGSKGGGILSFIAIFSLVRLQSLREYVRFFRVPLLGMAAVVSLSVFVLGKFLALDPIQMLLLMLSRIFINNDARALAIDLSGSPNWHSVSLFRESFRSYATLLGTSPAYPPLGQYLYMWAFRSNGFVGANTSSTALMILYGSGVEKIIFSIGICMLALGICLFSRIRGQYSIIRLAIGIFLLSSLSQDFLAFQLAVNILMLVAILFLLFSFGRYLLIYCTKPSLVS
ncbi:hypothetical protein [Edaphobacter flagellatus]|uniref:hypothetical protein n=1 Tax=Edaphobacter flagellatus TaxID=1933044 RepID=UPI0021B1D0AF|nr:hypothetical protein [Edaphobacter flagellatus]